jgi:16S rRNA (guanine966-N2)-methyltransferase
VSDAATFLKATDRSLGPFDLVFCDPPYADSADLGAELQELDAGWLWGSGWTVVLSRGSKSSMPVIPLDWRAARELRYGDSLLTLLQPKN